MVDEQLRVSDADRERVADRLRRAHADGRITLVEFDERVGAAYAAVTYADLVPLTADLPAEHGPGLLPGPAGAAGGAARVLGASGGTVGLASGSIPSRGSSSGPRRGSCGRARPGAGGRALAFRIEGAAWLFASLVNLLIWGLVSLTAAEPVYPWWIWVAGPWGAVLLLRLAVPRQYAGR